MKKTTMKHLLTGALALGLLQSSFAQSVKQLELKKFDLQSSAVIHESGAAISSPQYKSRDYWFPVTVPSTVLTGLVANKVYPDPYTGMNNMLIPDASDSFNRQFGLEKYSHLPGEPNPWKKPYWYRTTFDVPVADKGKLFQLIFKGINYRADVWLNGKQVIDSSSMAGMFAEYALDVTSLVQPGSKNALAVLIYQLDEPGLPAPPQTEGLGDFYLNGGPTGDIGKNVTMLSSIGWDWIPEVHDRNIGIWQPVYLRTSGKVVIEQPRLVTDLPKLPDTTVAELSLQLHLNNYSDQAASGKLQISIRPETFAGASFTVEQAIDVPAASVKEVSLTKEQIRQFILSKPHLWWPNNYGRPDLYRISLRYTSGNTVSDEISFTFGVRTVSSSATDVNGWMRREFFVNGKRVHLVGGAWVPDMMLNRDSLRYDQELQLCRNANVNLVRIWGGGLGETDDFYNAADKYGMMVWQDFWVTGDTHGEFKGSADYPEDGTIFKRNIISTILRIRNHPSLLVWTGGNEGHARKELYDAMRDGVATLDGTRPFIPSSSGYAKQPAGWNGSWPDNKPAGVYSGGPYSWQDAAEYYKRANDGKDWVFKDETGLPSQPPYASLAKIISNLVPDPKLPYPLNNTWGYHDACTGNGHYEQYYDAMKIRYGAPVSMKDFSDKMQLVNADGYRGIFEAAGHKLNDNGGVMLWKLNAAFPSVVWQVYDWYLEPNAGYYFMQRACEPVHIQLNLDDSAVAVINRAYALQNGLKAEADIYNMEGRMMHHQSASLSLKGSDLKEVFSLSQQLAGQQGVSFIMLHLKDAQGRLLSSNTYWLQAKHDYTSLASMKKTQVELKMNSSLKKSTENSYTITITNHSAQLAFFLNPQVMNGEEEIMPCYWSDNYLSLAPGESRTITVRVPAALQKPGATIRVSGWNVETAALSL